MAKFAGSESQSILTNMEVDGALRIESAGLSLAPLRGKHRQYRKYGTADRGKSLESRRLRYYSGPIKRLPAWFSNRVRAHNFKLFSNLQT